jgi:hypothetical protein
MSVLNIAFLPKQLVNILNVRKFYIRDVMSPVITIRDQQLGFGSE